MKVPYNILNQITIYITRTETKSYNDYITVIINS